MKIRILDVEATGRKIRQLRIERNLTVEMLAERMGFSSVQAVHKWQRGDSAPTTDNLILLSDILEVPTDEILQRQTIEIEGYGPLSSFYESISESAGGNLLTHFTSWFFQLEAF